MTRLIAPQGVVAYNGYRFPGPMRTNVSGIAIPDRQNRITKYMRYTVTVEGIMLPDDLPTNRTRTNADPAQTDKNILTLRQRLLYPGKELQFFDQGFGPLVVNFGRVDVGATFNTPPPNIDGEGNAISTILKDAVLGPHPKIVSWRPVGGNGAADIKWECETTISECSTFSSSINPPFFAEFNYEVAWAISQAGMTTRTITGTLEIPMSSPFAGQPLPTDTADNWRDTIKVQTIEGYHREQDYRLSVDKRTLTFSVIDTQIPSDSPYFPGILNIDAHHKISSAPPIPAINWSGTISATIEVAANATKAWAWEAFRALVQERFANMDKGAYKANYTQDTEETINSGRITLITGISIDESIFTRTTSFSLTYTWTCSIDKFLEASGLWTRVNPGITWDQWTSSLSTQVTGVRGVDQLAHDGTEDIVISMCGGSNEPAVIGRTPRTELSKEPIDSSFLDTTCPPEKESWLCYEATTKLIQNTPFHRHISVYPDASTASLAAQSVEPQSRSDYFTGSNNSPYSPSTSQQENVDATRELYGSDEWVFVFEGYAKRICFTILPPEIVSIGGQKVTRIQNIEKVGVVGKSGSKPIYGAYWRKTYNIPGAPSGNWQKEGTVTDGKPEQYPQGSCEGPIPASAPPATQGS